MTARILIAEDEILIGKDIERMLTRQGYEVCDIVSTGQDAIAGVLRHQPDLVIMDINLRGEMDGVMTIARIHKLLNLPVIYLTAFSDPETLQKAKITRPYGYLIKPVMERELSIVVDMALNLFESERKLQEGEVQYRAMLETALDGFWVIDSEGWIMDVNETYSSLIGYPRGELVQMHIKDLEAAEDPATIQARMDRVMTIGWDRFESRHRAKDGRLLDFEISIRYIQEQKLSFVYLRNITDLKQTQKEIFQLNADLNAKAAESLALYQSEHEQRQFAEMISEASQMLVSTLDMNLVLDRILQQISRIVQNDVCNIVLLQNEQTEVVRSHGYEGFDAGSFIETFVFPLSGLPVRRQIIETGESIVVPDVREDTRWRCSSEEAWLRSYIAIPIHVQGEVVGLINLGTAMPGYYTADHARRLQVFAYQAAIALQNARLFESTRKNAAQLEALSLRLLETQENEKRSLARELHDEIGQGLTAAELNLHSLLRRPEAGPLSSEIQNCIDIVKLSLKQVRNMSLDLHPSLLDDLGLVPTLRWLIDRESQWFGFSAQLIVNLPETRLPPWLELVGYRVVQEALTNAARHAQAQHVVIEIWKRGSGLHLIVRDDGVGFKVQEVMENIVKGASLGLLGMQERIALVNGTLEINSTPGEGSEIHARIPLTAHRPGEAPRSKRGRQ